MNLNFLVAPNPKCHNKKSKISRSSGHFCTGSLREAETDTDTKIGTGTGNSELSAYLNVPIVDGFSVEGPIVVALLATLLYAPEIIKIFIH